MHRVEYAAVNHQSGISYVATVSSNAPREDVQTSGRGGKAVVSSVESVAVIGLDCVESDSCS